MQFRSCGECTACCDGNLKSNSHGNVFKDRNPCIFLVNKLCSIYNDRPNTCRNYQCAWSQYLLDEDLRPDLSGVLVSVEKDLNDGQFLKVIQIKENVDFEILDRIKANTKKLNAKTIFVAYGE
jgi:Fe-S-cluster containining protein